MRRKEGPLLTSLPTGEASSPLFEAYRLHPNAIKALAWCGQGYSLADEGLAPVASLPPLTDCPAPRVSTLTPDDSLPESTGRSSLKSKRDVTV